MSFCTGASSDTAVLGVVLSTCGSGLSGCTMVVPGCVSNSAACTLLVANPTTPNTPIKRIGAVTQRFLALYVLKRFFTSVCCFMYHSPRFFIFSFTNNDLFRMVHAHKSSFSPPFFLTTVLLYDIK